MVPTNNQGIKMQALNHIKAGKPWNKGKLMGQKPPLKLREIWAICIRLKIARHYLNLAPFNLAIDSRLRSVNW